MLEATNTFELGLQSTELKVKATEECKAAVDANGCRTAVSVEVESSAGRESCV